MGTDDADLQAMKPVLVSDEGEPPEGAVSPPRADDPGPPDGSAAPASARDESANATSGLTSEAVELLEAAESGGVPMFVSQQLRRIASDNGVEVSSEMTPNQILEELRARANR